METTKRQQEKRGRPRVARRPGERSTLSLRVTSDLFDRLNAEAVHKGRPLSNEAEFRLEQSFASDVPPRLRDIGQDWLLAFAHFGMQAAQDAGKPELLKSLAWLDDPDCFRRALAGASFWVVQSGHAPSVSVEYRRSIADAHRERDAALLDAEERELVRRREAVRKEQAQ